MFLRDYWYVGAYAAEIGEKPLARTILGEPVLLYRTTDGRAIAMEDRCCHRNLPLSMGIREGDAIRCGYHGLKFDSAGQCIEIPGQAQIPPDAKVKTYPAMERWNLIWLWMGDAAKRDESLLPQWQCIDDPALTTTMGNGCEPLPMKCNWELNNDNLLDLTHVVFVHPSTLGGAGLDNNPVTTLRLANSVRKCRADAAAREARRLQRHGFRSLAGDDLRVAEPLHHRCRLRRGRQDRSRWRLG